MNDPALVRALGLLVPVGAVMALIFARRPGGRLSAAILLSVLWNFTALLAVNQLALHCGWWEFHCEGALLAGVPLDLLLGWALLWGALPLLATQATKRFSLYALSWASLFLLFDLLLMPRLAPALTLKPTWLLGEGLALLTAWLPGCWFGWITANKKHISHRACMQFLLFSALVLWLLPLSASHENSLAHATVDWRFCLGIQLLLLAALLGVSAVMEFAARGNGTPLPMDPPERLVVSGPYAYVANPMQLSLVLVLLVEYFFCAHNLALLAGAGVAIIYSVGFASWDEGADLDARYGMAWRDYRAGVRAWLPRWHPAIVSPGTLYLAAGCGPCDEVRNWFSARHPVGLRLADAQDFPGRDLDRVTYVGPDGYESAGVTAIARGLEHLNFAWALAGFALRLPGVREISQLLVDALGGGPRLVPRRNAVPD